MFDRPLLRTLQPLVARNFNYRYTGRVTRVGLPAGIGVEPPVAWWLGGNGGQHLVDSLRSESSGHSCRLNFAPQFACVGQRPSHKKFPGEPLQYLPNPFQNSVFAVHLFRGPDRQIVCIAHLSEGCFVRSAGTYPVERQYPAIECEVRFGGGEIRRAADQGAMVHR